MSRRRFAAYFIALIVILACVDLIIRPDSATPESAWGMFVLVLIAIAAHPKGRE